MNRRTDIMGSSSSLLFDTLGGPWVIKWLLSKKVSPLSNLGEAMLLTGDSELFGKVSFYGGDFIRNSFLSLKQLAAQGSL